MTPDVDRRIAAVVDGADLSSVADALAAGRTATLERWLAAAAQQPFHRERPDGAVADHIPGLFDAVVDLLRRSTRERKAGPSAPLDDDAITTMAERHAQARFEQGLGSVAVVTEFRLLRQEVARSLAALLEDDAAPADVVAGIAIVDDALDGAATVSLTALYDQIENLRESFLATTLHDIRQPVTLIEGSLHLADRWLTGPAMDSQRIHETVADALSATIELVAMIDTLSDASRVAMGALDPEPEPASLEALVRGSIQMFGTAARDRVTVEAPSGPHLIGLWDPRLIHRLVANLVGNALKYSATDAAVRVILERAPGPVGRMTVADEGLGMSDDELATVFDRFARADRVRQRGIPGLGLGLYACRGIVTAHGGTITVRSEGHDRGATVVIDLPLMDDVASD
ncbi:MAG: sensor histidine kinase [Candidatus Limnocylindrales bacterium]